MGASVLKSSGVDESTSQDFSRCDGQDLDFKYHLGREMSVQG